MAQIQDLRAVGDRIERLLEEIAETADPSIQRRVDAVVRLVTEVHGAAIERILEIAVEVADVDTQTLFARLTDDELVASLLVVHGLHPDDLTTRIERALEGVRPYLGSHGGDVELLGVDDEEGTVLLKMLGSCNGCPSSSVTLKLAVESAITEAAPEIVRIDVDGAAGEPAEQPAGTPVRLTRKSFPADPADQWAPVYGLNRLGNGRLETLDIADNPVVCCRVDGELYAYRDRCPACGAAMRDGSLQGEIMRCGGCGATFDVQLAGRSADGASHHLEPLPLLTHGGTVKIAVPAGVGS